MNLLVFLWVLWVMDPTGNALGRFLKADTNQVQKGILTYACICVELDLS
jgi:hypothetical protein